MRTLHSTILMALLATGCAQQATQHQAMPSGTKLTGEEIKSAFAGNTLIGSNPQGATFVGYYGSDGTVRVKGKGAKGQEFVDNGTVRYTTEGFCTKFDKIRDGKEACFTAYRDGSTYRAVSGGDATDSTFKIEPGNPTGL